MFLPWHAHCIQFDDWSLADFSWRRLQYRRKAMTRLLRFTTVAAVSLVASGIAISASATTLGIELEETGFTTFSTSSSSNPLVVVQSFGTFSTNVEVNTLGTNPLSLDLGSTNISTSTPGTLTIVASASGLTSPIGLEEFISQFTGHLVSGSGGSVEL